MPASSSAEGDAWLTPAELGLSYRHSELRHGQVVAEVEYRLTPRPPDEIKQTVRELIAQRKATQPTNKRTFGSVFKNPEHELGAGQDARGVRAERARDRRRHDLAEACELHRERRRRDDRRRARADGRGASPRPRAVRSRARARSAAARRDPIAGHAGRAATVAKPATWPEGEDHGIARARERARSTASALLPAQRLGRSPRAGPRRSLRPFTPHRVPDPAHRRSASMPPRAERPRSRSTGSPSRAPRPRSRPRCERQLAPALGESLLGLDLDELDPPGRGRPDGGRRVVRPRLPAHARDRRRPRGRRSRCSARDPRPGSPRPAAESSVSSTRGARPGLPANLAEARRRRPRSASRWPVQLRGER